MRSTPARQAIRRLITASRVMNASTTANSGGITDIQDSSICG